MSARDCDCCAGRSQETPRAIDNPPGLSAIAYRVGTHSRFKESILARLSGIDLPALEHLRSREDSDFSIALCDATAMMLDVLSFYQERIANEAFLRTATERRSVLELARLIGYELGPGVAASAHLAFTLSESPGQPSEAAQPAAIPVGTRVQSVPGQDEQAQTFETVEPITARVEWNAIGVQVDDAQPIYAGLTELYLQGIALQLAPGDVILLVGSEREGDSGSEHWDVRVLTGVDVSVAAGSTHLRWKEDLGHIWPFVAPAAQEVQLFVFRQRAALFGHNAPDPNLLSNNGTKLDKLAPEPESGGLRQWERLAPPTHDIDLDAAYPKIAPGSWLALVNPTLGWRAASFPGYVELYRALSVAQANRVGFGLAGKVTRVTPDSDENLSLFDPRETAVFAQSERLIIGRRPLEYPVYGAAVPMARIVEGLAPGQTLAVTGKRARLRILRVPSEASPLSLSLPDGSTSVLGPGDSLQMAGTPVQVLDGGELEGVEQEDLPDLLGNAAARLRWTLIDRDGKRGTLECSADLLAFEPALAADEQVAEVVRIADGADAVFSDRDRTHLTLDQSLVHCYDRISMTVNANVARATHGESVGELLGNGDAPAADQRFELKQAPLTYVSANTPSGRASTLEVRVNDLKWDELPTLYAADRTRRAFEVAIADNGKASVIFGDGAEGARLPSGVANVRAKYRKGLGRAGNVRARQLKTLLSRPLGVTGVINPEAASGGDDPESLADARENAPLTVLTLERAVSISDYADYARTFAGIAKAHAVWLPSGVARGVFVTVAGVNGAAIDEMSDTHHDLLASLRRYGDRLLPLTVKSYRKVMFTLRASIRPAADAEPDKVLSDVEATLRTRFSFSARRLGQPVTRDEVLAAIHEVASVEAVSLQQFYRDTPPLEAVLRADLPVATLSAMPLAAELLTLDPGPLALGVMS
jgi:predicted phage baseplate assembly protein